MHWQFGQRNGAVFTIATVIEPNLPPTEATSDAANDVKNDVASPKFLKTIKSFVRRAGRITTGQSKAFEDLGEQYLLNYQVDVNAIELIAKEAINTPANDEKSIKIATFPEKTPHPVVFEIGFGMGEATAHIAALLPNTRFLACEVHQPGVGALLKRIGESLETDHPIDNIRIISHDAVEVIDHMLPLASLDGVHIFFPDPWHKKRHNKRRLIQQPLIAKLAARLKVGGNIHCATDWQEYAEQILDVLSAEPLLKNRADHVKDAELAGYSPKPHYRPLTKFENRGIKLGHGVWDIVFERV
jgi:tRNA (guanine-N7-)-methyltransferase